MTLNVNELCSITMLTLTMTNNNDIASKFNATICILFVSDQTIVLIIRIRLNSKGLLFGTALLKIINLRHHELKGAKNKKIPRCKKAVGATVQQGQDRGNVIMIRDQHDSPFHGRDTNCEISCLPTKNVHFHKILRNM